MVNGLKGLLERLIAAELPAATERVAVRLVALSEETPSGQGLLVMGWDEFGALCGRANRNAARRHLTALAKAGLLHYSTDAGSNRLFVTWLVPLGAGGAREDGAAARRGERVDAPLEDEGDGAPGVGDGELARGRALGGAGDGDFARQRAVDGAGVDAGDGELAHGRAVGGAGDAELARQRAVDGAGDAELARGRAVGGAAARLMPHTRGVGGGGDRSTEGEVKTTTNHPPGIRTRLRSLGLKPEAVAVEAGLSVHEVAAILDAWERDVRNGEVGTGALIYRLKNGITPPRPGAGGGARGREKDYKPAEFADVILGG